MLMTCLPLELINSRLDLGLSSVVWGVLAPVRMSVRQESQGWEVGEMVTVKEPQCLFLLS